jgi:hypothetical protein
MAKALSCKSNSMDVSQHALQVCLLCPDAATASVRHPQNFNHTGVSMDTCCLVPKLGTTTKHSMSGLWDCWLVLGSGLSPNKYSIVDAYALQVYIGRQHHLAIEVAGQQYELVLNNQPGQDAAGTGAAAGAAAAPKQKALPMPVSLQ